MKKRQGWLYLLLLPALGGSLMLSIGAWEVAALYLAVTALGFGLEALMLYLFRNRMKWLRLLPLALLAVPVFLAWLELDSGGFLCELGAALWLSFGLCGLCGWGAAWALTGLPAFQSGGQKEKSYAPSP